MRIDMDYFFTTFFPMLFEYIFAGLLVIILILDIINHLGKKKLIELVLQSEEKRQRYIRIDSMLVSGYGKILWQVLAILPVIALSIYYFLPNLFPSLLYPMIEVILFCILMLDDYFYRKSFLKAINKKIESEIP
jgi:hypothetical protein